MGQQAIATSFQGIGAPNPVNLIDGVASVYSRSPGASIATNLTIQPPLGQAWLIVGWQLLAYGYLGNGNLCFGRPGNLIAGPFLNGNPIPPNPSNGLLLPTDSTNLETIWDGANDPPFATESLTGPGSLIQTSRQLQAPLQVAPGDRISFGMYLTRSLGFGYDLFIANASFVLIIDDGQSTNTGWGGA